MDSCYRRYVQHIPKYLVDRPRELVTHCLKKISMANSGDLTEIVMTDHGLFSTLSHKCGYKERYMTNFGDEDNMPYCTCWNWESSAYPCEHFFAIFQKFPDWQWNALSPLYRNSPFLTLDKMEHNAFQKSTEDEKEHVTNFENPSIDDEEMLINGPCDDLNVLLPKQTFKTSLAAECKELLQRLKNLTCEVEESSAELKELHKTFN